MLCLSQMHRATRPRLEYWPGHSVEGHIAMLSPHSASIENPDVSVLVVNYNTAHLLDRMFAALEASRGDMRTEVFVVDNASCDNSLEVLRTQHANAEVIANMVNV